MGCSGTEQLSVNGRNAKAFRLSVIRCRLLGDAQLRLKWLSGARSYLILSDTLYQFHSHVFPPSGEKAWLQTGRSLSRASHRNITMTGLPLKVSFAKKWPTLFSNEPTTGGSRTPTLLATQYKLHNLVFGLKSLRVRPSKGFPCCPGISVVE